MTDIAQQGPRDVDAARASVRDFNAMTIVVGLPGHGKTTVVRGEVLGHLNNYANGRAFVHDINRQFVDLCAPYEDVAAYKRAAAAAAAAKRPLAHGASVSGSARELIEFCIALGRRWNTAGNVRLPMRLAFDETSAMDTSGPTHMDALDTYLVSNRRHLGIAPIYNVQRPTALTEAFYTQATKVIIFAQPSERRTRVLEEYLGLPDHALLPLVGAPKFRYALWLSGQGLVDPSLQQSTRQLGGV